MVDNGYFMDIFHGIASSVASRNSGRDFWDISMELRKLGGSTLMVTYVVL